MIKVMQSLVLNSIMALIPVALAYGMVLFWRLSAKGPAAKSIIVALGLVWLAFLPNTCYLLTQWRHFLVMAQRENLINLTVWSTNLNAFVVLMAYYLFFLAYSLLGMIAFTLSIRLLVPIARQLISRLWMVAVPLFFLVSLGVYLGLIWRFNSWDLLHRVGYIWSTVVSSMSRPLLAAVIIGFAGFLWLGYLVVDIWIDGLAYRLRKRRKAESATCTTPKHPDWIDG